MDFLTKLTRNLAATLALIFTFFGTWAGLTQVFPEIFKEKFQKSIIFIENLTFFEAIISIFLIFFMIYAFTYLETKNRHRDNQKINLAGGPGGGEGARRASSGAVFAGRGGGGTMFGGGGGGGGGLRVNTDGSIDAGGGGGGGGISAGGVGGGPLGGGGGGATGAPPGFWESDIGVETQIFWMLKEEWARISNTDDAPPADWANTILKAKGYRYIYTITDGCMTLQKEA